MREAALVTEDLSFKQDELPADRSLVIIDDDRAFLQRLVRAMELRGFEVRFGHSVAEGVDLIKPNLREMRELTGSEPSDAYAWEAAEIGRAHV